MRRGVAFAAAVMAVSCMGMGAVAGEAITEAAGEELAVMTEATSEETSEAVSEAVSEEVSERIEDVTEAATEKLTEAATEEVTEEAAETVTEAAVEAITEAETEEETLEIPDLLFGEWQQLGYGDGDYAMDSYSLFLLPDSIISNYEDVYTYELQEDGSAVVNVTLTEEEMPENVNELSCSFEKRMLEEADLETYGLPEDAEAYVGKAPVLVFTTTVNSIANPLADETIQSSTLYANAGYTDAYIDKLLTANEWQVGENKLAFSLGEKEIEGTLSMNDGERTGTFMVFDGVISMYWNDESFDYSIQSVSEEPETRGNVVLVETGDETRTLELNAIRPEAAESETETNAQG